MANRRSALQTASRHSEAGDEPDFGEVIAEDETHLVPNRRSITHGHVLLIVVVTGEPDGIAWIDADRWIEEDHRRIVPTLVLVDAFDASSVLRQIICGRQLTSLAGVRRHREQP